jgi:sialate O-acetylesterase
MQWSVNQSNDAEAEIAAGTHPTIRLFSVPLKAETKPMPDVDAEWHTCRPETVSSFSAVGYFFGRELNQVVKVPIGLVNTSWGGTYAEAWTSREGLLSDPYYRTVVTTYEEQLADHSGARAEYDRKMAEGEASYYPRDPGNDGLGRGWADPATDISDWPAMTIPSGWKISGLALNGIVWFRRDVEIPAAWAGRDLVLRIGSVDKIDITYWNNQEVGSTPLSPMSWCAPRRYTVPGAFVKAGRNVLAVRACSHVFEGGLIGPAHMMKVSPADDETAAPISLPGSWRYQVEHDWGQVTPFPGMPAPQGQGTPNSPYILHHSMIEPLLPMAIRGAIWYQGESNAGQAWRYRTLFSLMIRDWRRAWGQGDFPFLFVQLANYRARKDEPAESDWAELREAQNMALALPHTGVAVTIDIGEGDDIHPRNKQDVGKRLARWALAKTYGHLGLMPAGPIYRRMTQEGAAIHIEFANAEGLTTTDGQAPRGFAVAGEDRKFVWADAEIHGSRVVVSHPAYATAVAVRYGWADNPDVNLVNADGLPASPFRTDDWPGITVPKS